MSEAPARCYREWATVNKNDERVKALEQSEGGFEGAISQWLNSRRDLILHCAILNYNYRDNRQYVEEWRENYIPLIEHLLTVLPSSHLEKKSNQGLTPLMIATALRKTSVVKLLIAAGASQRTRDKQDRNVIHLLLERRDLKPTEVGEILDCFDKNAVKQMMLERCKVSPTALTPLALWLSQIVTNDIRFRRGVYQPEPLLRDSPEILKILTEYSSGEDLEMLNGEGDLPLHVAVKKGLTTITSHLLSLRPDLLHRENATGRTPLEMASDIYLRDIVSGAPGTQNAIFDNYHTGRRLYQSVANKPNKDFLPKNTEEEAQKEVRGKKETYEVCVAANEALKRDGVVKRRLVSLNEANEVARRLTVAKGEEGRKVRLRSSGEIAVDEVEEWMR